MSPSPIGVSCKRQSRNRLPFLLLSKRMYPPRPSMSRALCPARLYGSPLAAPASAGVKAACRKMALKPHPDRVATLGDDVRKAAEQKFKEIGQAKDKVYAARGLR